MTSSMKWIGLAATLVIVLVLPIYTLLEPGMQEKLQEIAELQEMIKSLQEDRSVMHNQVTGLIDRIGEWEKVFDQDDPGEDSNSGHGQTQNLSEKSRSLFNVATEQPL